MKSENLSRKELEKAIIEEKLRGVSDIEIGRKYGVSYKFLEKLIVKTQGISVSSFKLRKRIKSFFPENFKEETTTVWSFPKRGNWATHSGHYRGNWSPYIPRNVIVKYSEPGDLVLDYFCGAGTTAIECKLLGRRCIAFDINEKAIELAKKNLDFQILPEQLNILSPYKKIDIFEPEIFTGDARDLSFLPDDSVDLICAHPPYANAIHYTAGKEGDLSYCNVNDFLKEMAKVAKESFRVLKPGKKCAILIGDIRKKKHVIPLGFKLINVYLDAGFKLRELVIKRQHNCKTTGFWYDRSIKYNFLLLAHEYLPIFEKPAISQNIVSEHEAEYRQYGIMNVKSKFKKTLKELETTTVWIFPEEDFEGALNRNIIERYSKDGNYTMITFIPSPQQFKFKDASLIFIKSPYLENLSPSDIKQYIDQLRNFLEGSLTETKRSRFLIIQTQDIRIHGCIEPIAKRIIDELENKYLWLKEIVIVTKQKPHLLQNKSEFLEIAHQYLLVYEVIK